MSAADKILYAVFAACVIGAVAYYFALSGKIQKQMTVIAKQTTEIARLELRLSECERAERDITFALSRQNAAIAKLRVDTVRVAERFEKVVKIYEETRQDAAERVEKDTSCENKIAVINDVMRTFSQLRAESRDKAHNYVP